MDTTFETEFWHCIHIFKKHTKQAEVINHICHELFINFKNGNFVRYECSLFIAFTCQEKGITWCGSSNITRGGTKIKMP
jgi:hypothetical protein